MMICDHAGKTPDCTICPEAKPHEPGAPPKGFTVTQSFCMGKTALEVTLINYKESNMETKEQVHATQPGMGAAGEKDVPAYLPPAIELIPVESSNIESVGHDGAETLRVRFKASVTRPATDYDYPGITEEEFLGLVSSPSIGKAYNTLTRARGIKGIKLA